MGDALTAITPSDDGPDGREVVMGKAAVSLAGGRDRWSAVTVGSGIEKQILEHFRLPRWS